MENSENLSLPYIMPAQAQKHVTHNEALRALDAVVQLSAESAGLASPPADPAAGARFVVAQSPTGEWAGREGQVAAFQDGAWAYHVPRPGWRCFIADSGRLLLWDGAAWIDAPAPAVQDNLTSVGINATADEVTRLAVSADASLFTHDGSSHQVKINKAAAADTASALFQTGFSGRAEFGLTSDDDFHVKVSADGAVWTEALVADKDNGNIGLGTSAPNYPLQIHRPGAAGASVHLTNGLTGGGATDGFWFGYSNQAYFWNYENTATQFATSNLARMTIAAGGDVGIGTAAPSTRLHVAGPVRCGQYATAGRPSAATVGAGTQIYDTTLSKPVWSDGTDWRDAAGTVV
jgi:Protein of unknown function (DUF2793)